MASFSIQTFSINNSISGASVGRAHCDSSITEPRYTSRAFASLDQTAWYRMPVRVKYKDRQTAAGERDLFHIGRLVMCLDDRRSPPPRLNLLRGTYLRRGKDEASEGREPG